MKLNLNSFAIVPSSEKFFINKTIRIIVALVVIVVIILVAGNVIFTALRNKAGVPDICEYGSPVMEDGTISSKCK